MIDFKNILTISRKELKSAFNNPTAYIILAVFLFLWEFLFFRNVFLADDVSLRLLFDFLPWLFIIFIPAITMGSFAQEKSDGTLELLLTHPLREYELVIGKFLGKLAFGAIALLAIIPIAFAFDQFGNLDWGQVLGQYLAGILMASVLISVGIFISSLFISQISALLVSAAATFFLIIAGFGFVTESLPLQIVPIFERLSVLSHFDSMARGVIDFKDVWYGISAAAIFLSLTYLRLIKQKFGNRRAIFRRFQIGILLFIGIAVLTNVVGASIPGRIDLTQSQSYTLSPATRSTVSALSDLVNITVYASSKLPSQLQPVLRDVRDTLRDYKTLSNGNINVSYKDPSNNPEIANEARMSGIREVQFNVIGQEEYQSKVGFLGLAISYASHSEKIPFIENTADLEYQLTSFIKKLTNPDKKKIVFISGHGERSIYSDFRILKAEMDKQFAVEEKSLTEEDSAIPENTAAIVLAGPTEKIEDKAKASIKEYLNKGGSGLFLIDAATINPETLTASANPESFAGFLSDYGITVNSDLVYDLRSNETVRMGGGILSLLLPYPFWVRVGAKDSTSPILANIESIVLPWASSLSVDASKITENKLTLVKLLSTTSAGGSQTGNFTLSPHQNFSQENLSEKLMAASIAGATGESDKKPRLIVVGDSDFLTDQFAQNSAQNIAFGMAALSWLGQEESLAGIKLKQNLDRKFQFENATQKSMVKYGNLAFTVLLPAIYGTIRLSRRRKMRKFTYTTEPMRI